MLVKTLLTFGANINPLNDRLETPLDMAISRQICGIVAILVSVGGKTGDNVLKEEDGTVLQRRLEPFDMVCKLLFSHITYYVKFSLYTAYCCL